MIKIVRCAVLLLALCTQAKAQTPCENCVPATLAPPDYWSIVEASYFYSGRVATSEAVAAFLLSRYGAFYAHCSAVSVQGIGPFTSNAWSGPTNNATKIDVATVTLAKGVGCGSPDSADYPASTQSFKIMRWQTASCPATFNITYPAGRDPVCEGPPKPKVVVLDPGHGTDCSASNMKSGAIGATDFPLSDPPPGRMREDVLTVTIAQEVQRILSSSTVMVILTKSDVNSCPTFEDRGSVANEFNAKLLVSIHIDAPNQIPGQDFIPSRNGSLAIYHPRKPEAMLLADRAAADVSTRLGLNNRGSVTNTELAMLKPRIKAPSIILEIARLSGTDEKILHLPGSRAAIAAGIKSAILSFLATQP